MLDVLTFVLAAVAVIVALQYLADRTGLPAAALLTVAGLVYGVLPGPNVTLDPHVILTFVIPPLIYSAALNSSLLAIRENMRTVISLSIGLVLATAVVTGIGMDLFVPGVGLAAGIALGAALSPTDPVAALAVGGRAGLPPKLITIIEGEGLLNDATALTTLTVAVTAATSGGFSFGGAVLRFLLSAAGGLLCGVAVAVIVRLLRSVVRDPLLVNGVSLATPFAAYLLIRGIKTFALRMERQNTNAQALAEFLAGHPRVTTVHYPGLPTHREHDVAKRQMRGYGGVVSFEVRGDIDDAARVVDACTIPHLAVSLGGVESLIEQPAIMSFYELTSEERLEIGIKDSLIRYSVGIEDADDLIADLAQALDR